MLIIHQCAYYYKQDLPLAPKKLHTHYLELKEKNLKNILFLFHLGPKLTIDALSRVKRFNNYFFTKDGMKVLWDGKKQVLTIDEIPQKIY